MIFWRFLAAEERITTKWMEIDYDYLRTGTAIGFRASRELFSNYLLNIVSKTCRCAVRSFARSWYGVWKSAAELIFQTRTTNVCHVPIFTYSDYRLQNTCKRFVYFTLTWLVSAVCLLVDLFLFLLSYWRNKAEYIFPSRVCRLSDGVCGGC